VDDLVNEFIAESKEGLDRMERCLTSLETHPDDSGLVGEIFRAVHTMKGTTGFLGFDRMEKLAHAGEHLLGSLRDKKLRVTSELISGLLRLMDGLRTIVMLIEDTGGEGTRVSDEDNALIAELRMLNGQKGAADNDTEQEHAVAGSHETASLIETSSNATNEKTVRIDVSVLNRMMNLVGELVLTRNQMMQSDLTAKNFPELTRRLDTVTVELRETVMQARMQPMGNLFGRFPRMVRDLARTCGRSVRVEFSGQETGLDKSLLESIKDPLTHAVRNAVDHGIEPSSVRVLAGKSAEGCVSMRAFHQGGWVVIEVSDDGAGIGIERVLSKAVERRLVTSEQAAAMSDREALQLIFLPGFSTAAAVTTVSGRGVGMDVIRENVERVGGRVEVESRVGVGSTLRLRVPLTLAIVPSLVVRCAGEVFALPQSALIELVDLPKNEREWMVGRVGSTEMYRLRDNLLPMVRLDRMLGLIPEDQRDCYLAVLEAEGRRYGLVVDDLASPEEIVVKPLSAVLREIGVFSGAAVLGNGTLALILDVAAVAARAGVKPTEVQTVELNAVENKIEQKVDPSFVIFEDRRRERIALPLDMVERIEDVSIETIEYAGGHAMMQYRGELLLLRDDGKVLVELREGTAKSSVTVLICGEEGAKARRREGMVVRHVLDVAHGTLIEREMSVDGMAMAMVKDRLTVIRRGFGREAA
jgi:two-component system chemotaxis sensor kinase CheA